MPSTQTSLLLPLPRLDIETSGSYSGTSSWNGRDVYLNYETERMLTLWQLEQTYTALVGKQKASLEKEVVVLEVAKNTDKQANPTPTSGKQGLSSNPTASKKEVTVVEVAKATNNKANPASQNKKQALSRKHPTNKKVKKITYKCLKRSAAKPNAAKNSCLNEEHQGWQKWTEAELAKVKKVFSGKQDLSSNPTASKKEVTVVEVAKATNNKANPASQNKKQALSRKHPTKKKVKKITYKCLKRSAAKPNAAKNSCLNEKHQGWQKWTEAELAKVKKVFSDGKPWSNEDLCNAFPGRTLDAILQKRHRLRLRKLTFKNWLDPELKKLREVYSNEEKPSEAKLKEAFPNRSAEATHTKAKRMGLIRTK